MNALDFESALKHAGYLEVETKLTKPGIEHLAFTVDDRSEVDDAY